MSLRSKILLILLGVAGLYALVDNGLLRLFATRIFAAWELEEAEDRMEQVVRAFDQEQAELDAEARIWAHRSDVLRFVTGAAHDFVASDLGRSALAASGVDFLYFCDPQGKVLWRFVRAAEGAAPVRLDVLPGEALSEHHFLLRFHDDAPDAPRVGLVMSSAGPLLVGAQPVRDAEGGGLSESDARGDRRARYGAVILGRFVDQGFLASVAAPHGFSLSIAPEAGASADPGERAELLAALQAGEKRFAAQVGPDDRLHVLARVQDARSGEGLLVDGATERTIYTRGLNAIRYSLFSTLASALLLLLVLLHLLQRIVIRPLGSLTRKTVEIGRTDDSTIRVGMHGHDEIGQLSTEFDRMLDKLAQSRAEVVRTARLAGMSEIATGVLHNVGNVLNSVNVSANLARSRIERLPVEDLTKLVGVLEDQGDLGAFVGRDPRGKHLVPFLSELSGALSKGRESLLKELRVLGSGIDHVADLVRAQQSYAGARGVFEFASLEQEVEAALLMCNQALGELTDVEVVREYEELPSIRVDRHKLMEILVNLIQNARQSLDEVRGRAKRLTLRLRRGAGGRVRIEVEDNGVGIPGENLTRIFHHGFTTKAKGHGFGLHVSANAATEMQAKLGVQSDGPGRGATFHLDLPVEDPKLVAAA